MTKPFPFSTRYLLILSWYVNTICHLATVVQVHSAPLDEVSGNTEVGTDLEKNAEFGNEEPVWSHGESYAIASATGEGAVLETDSWTHVDNHGGLQVNNVTSNGTVIGYQVAGLTNCSQESHAYAVGSWSANALAYGWCNSSVLLDQPVSNAGTGYGREVGDSSSFTVIDN